MNAHSFSSGDEYAVKRNFHHCLHLARLASILTPHTLPGISNTLAFAIHCKHGGRGIARLVFGTIVCIWVAAFGAAADDSCYQFRLGGDGGGAGRKISRDRDLSFIRHPAVGHSEKAFSAPETETLRRIWTSRPEGLDGEGVFVWKGADEVWHVALSATNTVAATVAITTDGDILLVKQSGEASKGANPLTTALSSAPGSMARQIQFRTTGKTIGFEVLLDGECDTSRVFVGRTKANPRASPFYITLAPAIEPTDRSDGFATLPKSPGKKHGQEEEKADGRSNSGGNAP